MKQYLIVVLLLSVLALAGCPAVCRQVETRCSGEGNPQVCDSAGHWRDVGDCGEVSELSPGNWTCQAVDGLHTCLPEVSR